MSNGDATSAHLKRFHANRHARLQALEDAGYQYDLLTTEQIEGGKLSGYRVLILPDSIALSDGEVAAMRKFVESGGLLLSDVETGLMDSHARWQAAGRLDDVLGVQRLETRSAPNDTTATRLHVTLSRGPVDFDVLSSSPSLRTTTGRPLAAAVAAPESARRPGAGERFFLVTNRIGLGRSISFNFWMTDYAALRGTPAQTSRLALLRDFLSFAGVRPVADVRNAAGKPLSCSEVVAFRRANSRYVAILPEPYCRDGGTFTLNLETPQYVYDLRAHRQLGRLSRIIGTLVPSEPLVYALETAPLGRLSVAPAD